MSAFSSLKTEVVILPDNVHMGQVEKFLPYYTTQRQYIAVYKMELGVNQFRLQGRSNITPNPIKVLIDTNHFEIEKVWSPEWAHQDDVAVAIRKCGAWEYPFIYAMSKEALNCFLNKYQNIDTVKNAILQVIL